MKHYIVRFEVAMFVAADDSQSAVFDAKMKLNDIDGIECAEDTDVCTLEELLGRNEERWKINNVWRNLNKHNVLFSYWRKFFYV